MRKVGAEPRYRPTVTEGTAAIAVALRYCIGVVGVLVEVSEKVEGKLATGLNT